MSSDDGFGSFADFGGDFGPEWTLRLDTLSASSSTTTRSPAPGPTTAALDAMDFERDETRGTNKGDRIYKRGLPLDVAPVVGVVLACLHPQHHAKAKVFLQGFIMCTYGQRNLRKDAIDESKLSKEQLEVYHRIRGEMDKPERRQRILDFINKKEITRRLINYFVVHYALIKQEMSYYLDRRTYPYKIIGTLNEPNQPDIIRLIDQGANIVWLNFHQEYKNSKNKNGRRNRHAPYRRSTSVKGADGHDYSLCELNFYIWLDDVGGFDLFYLFENDIRDQKAEDARIKRQRDEEQHTVLGKRRKEKVVLRKTDGRNYKTFAVACHRPAAFSITPPTCTFSEYLALLRQTNKPVAP